MASAVLSGYAVPALRVRWWDHTYVKSSDGYSWGCFGRDTAGMLLADAVSDSAVADCLAKPIQLPTIYAGIRYGLTGVCHQAANRILYVSGITVAKARGYGFSVATWGTYGRGIWPERDQCLKLAAAVQTPALPKGDEPDMPSKIPPFISGDNRNTRRAELQALVDSSLGPSYDRNKIAIIADLQEQLHQEQDKLVNQLDRQFINRRQYLEQFNAMLHRIYSQSEKVLGSQDFEKLFGAPLNQIEHMIDPDVFLSTH